ncbi:MAG: DUF3791 domain-containing protein [Oscillospiraceae bacterium]|nr:DUF3791 domain-containing protein [Oscillospiraceae bacterium]
MSSEVMEFMVWLVERVARKFFDGNKRLAYNQLKATGLWEHYVRHYETSHTLNEEYLLVDIKECLERHG